MLLFWSMKNYISDCCGYHPKFSSEIEIGVCGECFEHCEYIDEEISDELSPEQKVISMTENFDLLNQDKKDTNHTLKT